MKVTEESVEGEYKKRSINSLVWQEALKDRTFGTLSW